MITGVDKIFVADAIIHFRNPDLIHAGDILFNGMYPFIDLASGGSVDGYIATLENLAAMARGRRKLFTMI